MVTDDALLTGPAPLSIGWVAEEPPAGADDENDEAVVVDETADEDGATEGSVEFGVVEESPGLVVVAEVSGPAGRGVAVSVGPLKWTGSLPVTISGVTT